MAITFSVEAVSDTGGEGDASAVHKRASGYDSVTRIEQGLSPISATSNGNCHGPATYPMIGETVVQQTHS